MPGGQLKGSEAREMYELKQQAVKYYSENGVPKKMEEILNQMFHDQPSDVYGHLVRGREVLDSKGQPTLQADIYCMSKNFERLVSTAVISSSSHLFDNAKGEEKEEEEKERQQFVAAAVEYIVTAISDGLKGFDPLRQAEGDECVSKIMEKLKTEEEERLAKQKEEELQEENDETPPEAPESPKKGKSPKGKNKGPAVVIIPDDPKEDLFCGSNAVCVVSQALCSAGAFLNKVPIYQHIASLRYDEVPEVMYISQPIITLLTSGKSAPGKLNCIKEFMIIPKPGVPLKESLQKITSIYNYIGKQLILKGGAVSRNVNDYGALVTAMDRPEQGLDMIQEAMLHLGMTPGEDFHLALNCAAQEIFDFDKGKYEIMSGQQKTYDDMIEYWAELLSRYPAVCMLIDPIRKQEKNQWMQICGRLTDRCYVVGDFVYPRPGLLKDLSLQEDFRTSGTVMRLNQVTTVTDMVQAAKKMQDADNVLIMSTSQGETSDTFIADMAVGVNARFLKIGAPCRGERVAKLNRLAQIEADLEDQGRLGVWGDYQYPRIKPLVPTEGGGNPGETVAESQEDATKKEDTGLTSDPSAPGEEKKAEEGTTTTTS